MKKHAFSICIILSGIIFLLGCSSTFLSTKPVIMETAEEPEIILEEIAADSVYQYYEEEKLLDKILQYHADAQTAYEDLDFGLVETKIDSAFMVVSKIDLESIDDEDLVLRFKSAVFEISRELGTVLIESDQIAREDYTSWIEELENIEDFKSGRWTEEELRKIVIRISLKSDIPIDYNEQVKKAINFFQTNRRAEMAIWLNRSGRYLPLIREILTEEELPQDLAYLSMIESGFNPKAYSRARAVGLWQFIYSTGRLYGLKRNEWIDERRDPVKSTRAAARHLKDLYKLYNDWNLAFAAYNCGAARITRMYQRTPDIDFWDMNLPRETRSYVPFFMAALIISKEPELFGFENIKYEPPLEFDTVEVHPYTRLSTAAEYAGVSVKELRELNVELRHDRSPAGKDMYPLKIPRGKKETFTAQYASYKPEKYMPPRVSTYYVRRGDTLSMIAQKHGVSLTSLMRANNLNYKSARRLRVGKKLKIPGLKRQTVTSTSSGSRTQTPVSKKDTIVYTVKKNDTLGLIAEEFNTYVSVIQKLNNMGRRTRIYAGKKLYVPQKKQDTISAQKPQNVSINTTPGQITYIIQKGDSLYEIARDYGVNYKDIMRWNKIKNHRKIYPGQEIIIKKIKG